MSNPKLTKEELRNRLAPDSRKTYYLYQVKQVANPLYTQDVFEYVNSLLETVETGETKLADPKIETITRTRSYKYSHSNTSKIISNRVEERIVLQLFKKKKSKAVRRVFGTLRDYQVPLKNSRDDKAGKIDFIHLQNDVLYLNEIKAPTSKESLMKAILEIQTYYQIVDHEKLRKDFRIAENVSIKKCITIFDGTLAYQQYIGDENSPIKQLLKVFDIRVIVLPQNWQPLERVKK